MPSNAATAVTSCSRRLCRSPWRRAASSWRPQRVWGRMSFQRRWREWLTSSLLELWLSHDNYRRLDDRSEPQLAEYRIAEDARALPPTRRSTLVVGLLASLLTAATFVVVL